MAVERMLPAREDKNSKTGQRGSGVELIAMNPYRLRHSLVDLKQTCNKSVLNKAGFRRSVESVEG